MLDRTVGMIKSGQIVPFAMLIMFFVVVLVIWRLGKRGWRPTVRTIAGLAAIEECVGRAAEMGKPVLINMGQVGYTPIGVAAMSVMAYTAEMAARKGAEIIVPVSQAEIIPTVEGMLKSAFAAAGNPEGFKREEQIVYLSPDQWAFCTGCQALLESRQVAAHTFIGHIGGSSMIIVETGARVGAAQIGGTTNLLQIPFFVAACDYTLIGEEVMTAGIYLSGQPNALSQIVGNDVFKILAMALTILGVALASAGSLALAKFLAS
jgi:hypothetical protein